ncbi:MAG: glycerol-3-phosphate 1-O-acyltransferase PlsY [Limisphaerales bacterium]
MPPLAYLLTALGAYLLGSVPFGYLAARLKGVDLRTLGSGNIGATNAMRVLGRPAGIAVFTLDALKGWTAVALLPLAVTAGLGAPGPGTGLRILAGVGAVLGHNYTCWLRFKGGKGIATSAGVLYGLMPVTGLIATAAFFAALAATRYVSVGSLAAALSLPVSAWLFEADRRLFALALLLGLLAIFRHRGNLRRLSAGTEPRLGQKPAAPPPA